MRTSRGWPFAALAAVALLCAVVAVCADPTGTASPAGEGRAVEDEGGELAMMAAGSGDADTIFDPFTPRLALAISTDDELLPNASVTLTVSGEARAAIDGGDVVVVLPTKAAMDYAGEGRQPYYPVGDTLPTAASWRLPRMGAGDTWERTVTVPAAAAGYYMVAATADTDGPEGDPGPLFFDESYAQAWMFVSATDGQLTDVFEDSLFPEGMRPVPGPFMTEAQLASREPPSTRYNENIRILVIYPDHHEGKTSFQPAVGAKVSARYTTADGKHTDGLHTFRIVPEDGIVGFPCPTENYPRIRGEVDLPNTIYVEGLEGFFPYYSAFRRDCGGLVGVTGEGHDYLPWRNLNDVIPIVEDTFGYARGPIKWVVDPEARYPYPHYIRRDDEVGLPGGTYAYPRVVAHEYTHALHHKGMGGLWETENCGYRESRESYTCAFSEGLAHYGGWAGVSDDTSEWSWEEVTHTNHPPDPKSTFSVARLFHDLIDGAKSILERPDSVAEPEDRTQLDARYIMDVFATCEVNIPRRGDDNWEDRNDVSDFVWCLENRIDTPYHTSVFPGIETPHDVRETAREPSDWDADSIRSTWLWNLCDDC